MANSSLVQAVIINVEANEQVKCLFNPKEYTF